MEANSAVTGMAMDRKIQRNFWDRHHVAIISLIIFIMIFIAVSYLYLTQDEQKVDYTQLQLAKVQQQAFAQNIPIRVTAVPKNTFYLDAVEGGSVEAILVEEGSMVQKNQELVVLSNSSLLLSVIRSEAEVTQQLNNLNSLELELEQNRLRHKKDLIEVDYQIIRVKNQLTRDKSLEEKHYISEFDLKLLEDELEYLRQKHQVTIESQQSDQRLQNNQMKQLRHNTEILKKNLNYARENLAGLTVKAPISGLLSSLPIEVGQSLAQGEHIGQIDSPDQFSFEAEIDEFYLPNIQINQQAIFQLEQGSYQLTVYKILPEVRDGRFRIELNFIQPVDINIRRGQSLPAKLLLSESNKSIVIPKGAFTKETGGNWVYVLDDDERSASKRNITLGRQNSEYLEVLSGLEPGETIITSSYSHYKTALTIQLQQ